MNCKTGSGGCGQGQIISPRSNPCASAMLPGQSTGYIEWGQMYPVDSNTQVPPSVMISPQIGMLSEQQVQSPSISIPEDYMQESLSDYIYTPGYLRTNIGNMMRVEFLIGSGMTSRTGILREVGASYIVLDSLDHTSRMMCDIYSIRFVTILQTATGKAMLGGFAAD